MFRFVRVFLGSAGLLLAAGPGPAMETSYLPSVWGVEEGLPQHVVSAVRQTRDGNLWCATYNGLARFDGVKFTVFDRHSEPPLPGRGVTALYEDASGVLWAGLENGAVHPIYGQTPATAPLLGPRAGGGVRSMAADVAGDLWVLWKDGELGRLRDGLKLTLPLEIDRSEPELALMPDGGGRLWLVHRSGLAEVRADGLLPADTGLTQEDLKIQRVTTAARGGLWVVAGGQLRRWDDGKWAEQFGTGPWNTAVPGKDAAYVASLLELRDGRLLLGLTEGGAALGTPGGTFQFHNRRTGLPHEWVRCLAEDHEGNLWLGTGGGGLVALRPRRVSMVQVAGDETPSTVQSLYPDPSGGMWAATEGGGLYHLQAGQNRCFREEEGILSPYVWSVTGGPDGSVWAGTWGGGLFVRTKEGAFQPAPGWPEAHAPVKILRHMGDGSFWVGGRGDMARWFDGRWTRQDSQGQSWSPPDQLALAEDGAGGIWVGLGNGDIVHRRGLEVRTFGKASGMPGDGVVALLAEDPGTLWAGTAGGGLVRLREGRAVILDADQGLPGRMFSQLLTDGKGYLWAGTYQGICRLSLAELHACADGKASRVNPLLLSRADGMASLECTNGGQPGACTDAAGCLWFPTSKGLAVVDPANIRTNPVPPPVRVESLVLDGSVVPAAPGPIKLGPGAERISVAHTALSFTAPDRVRFRTRLDGLETQWQEAGPERTASYRYLPPGDYTFHVMACNNDGIWNPLPASLSFHLRPHWWQRSLHQGLGAAAAALALTALVWVTARRRNAARLERLERSHALERERARIARDIHDDLGSGLTRIMLLSESARSELPPDSAASGDVEAIRRAADDLTRAMDEIVWAVDPRHDSLDSLVGYVGSTAQEFLKAAGLRFRLEAPDAPPAWPLAAECRYSLFLAFREALHNVIRHARAQTVRVVFAVEPQAFTLTVEDDGSGFDPATAVSRPGGGRGLTHMKERLAERGGTCILESRPGHGTRVTFRLPVAAPSLS